MHKNELVLLWRFAHPINESPCANPLQRGCARPTALPSALRMQNTAAHRQRGQHRHGTKNVLLHPSPPRSPVSLPQSHGRLQRVPQTSAAIEMVERHGVPERELLVHTPAVFVRVAKQRSCGIQNLEEDTEDGRWARNI